MRSKFVMQIRATYTSTHLCSQAECACLRKPVRVIEWSCMQYEGAMRRNRLRATRNAPARPPVWRRARRAGGTCRRVCHSCAHSAPTTTVPPRHRQHTGARITRRDWRRMVGLAGAAQRRHSPRPPPSNNRQHSRQLPRSPCRVDAALLPRHQPI